MGNAGSGAAAAEAPEVAVGGVSSLVGSNAAPAPAGGGGDGVSDLANRWREINGENNWEGLISEPKQFLDETLRQEIIRYGEFAQVMYDAFDNDSYSKYCGSCRYRKSKLLEAVGLPNRGYEVTRYIYATEDLDFSSSSPLKMLKHSAQPPEKVWSTVSNWIGYVAVCTDEKETRRIGRRDILVAWRGTITDPELVSDCETFLAPLKDPLGYAAAAAAGAAAGRSAVSLSDDIKVDAGFWSLYNCCKPESLYNKTSAREQVNEEVLRLVDLYNNNKGPDETLSITLTGHSLGSSLAMLTAYDLAQEFKRRKLSVIIPITIFSFAGPRVGNEAFKKRFEKELGIKALRVVNVNDIVPKFPGLFANETRPELSDALEALPWTYSHVGREHKVDNTHSRFLDPQKATIGHRHNLEQYLHLVDGYGRYSLPPRRDVALVNKGCDFLKSAHFVPAQWRQTQNKGLVRNPDGTWTQATRELDDIPVPPPPTGLRTALPTSV